MQPKLQAVFVGGPFAGSFRLLAEAFPELRIPYDQHMIDNLSIRRQEDLPDDPSSLEPEPTGDIIGIAIYVKGDDIPQKDQVDMRWFRHIHYVFDAERSSTSG